MTAHGAALPEPSAYRRLFRNCALRWLWTGEIVSVFGDACFNLAVVWVIYAQSRSALQTAIVQVVWQLADFLCGPVAGVLADRWDRQRIMVVTNVLAAAVVGAVAIGMSTRRQTGAGRLSSGNASPMAKALQCLRQEPAPVAPRVRRPVAASGAERPGQVVHPLFDPRDPLVVVLEVLGGDHRHRQRRSVADLRHAVAAVLQRPH